MPERTMPEEIEGRFYPDFERNWRRAELVGRTAMLVAIVATLAGFLGGGPATLWKGKATRGDLEVEYGPVVRFGTPTGLAIRVGVAPGQKQIAITLPADIASQFGLQSVTPRPSESVSGPGEIRMVFPVTEGASRALVQLGGMPAQSGRMRLSAQLDGQPPLTWSQLVLP